jgi:tetratricopeptide (TPR) repeat protein
LTDKQIPFSTLLAVGLVLLMLPQSLLAADAPSVRIWEQDEVLPTYLAGDPEPNPMFYFGRMSQGAEGRVYPYPLYDTLTGKKVNKTYRMVYLENEYVKIGVLPEIGGRIFSAVDKTNGYDFFYRQHVIKPALIGLIGAWISGGVEWNVPHHHRASTFIPVQHRLEENEDGSKTVWVGELELRHRMRWAIGYTLRPGKSYLEVSLRILNRTPVVNTMLCFANVAVHVNEDYQVIFPPSTQYGTHHHKREFTKWPVADGRYGGWDFSGGTDVSWFKNHTSANSIFAWNYVDDFVAGYDHGKKAGTMAVANHHIVPGKKLWTWGNGPRGRMWDHILTDEDGPYIEIMVGAYSDNQPDYSWLSPYEVKSFEMYWYPFRDIGGAKEANLDAAVNLDVTEQGTAKVGFYTTSAYPRATVLLKAGDKVILDEKVAISPGTPYGNEVSIPAGVDKHDLRAAILVDGKELVSYSPIRLEPEVQPEEVKAPPTPKEIENNEELYLTGLWIEQFHNPNLDPDPYWEEALRRDPGDVRVNTALGIRYLKKARYADAEKHLRKALERLTSRHETPKNAEPTYYLGLALRAQGKDKEAYDRFYKATWNAPWRDIGYYAAAEIAAARGDLETALDHVNRSLDANALNIRALNLKAAVLRHLGRSDEARQVLATAFRRADPLDVRSMAERWLLSKSSEDARILRANMTDHPATGLETAAEYLNAGLWQDGTAVLSQMVDAAPDKSRLSPMVYYYLAYFAEKLGQPQKVSDYYRLAMTMPPDYVYPFQNEAEYVLRQAITTNPNDARAPYYLGNLLFDWQPEEAVKLWEKSASLDPSFPIVHRNLGIAYSHQEQGNVLDKAIASLEKAVSQSEKYPIHFYELDQLYEAAATSPEKRLNLLEKNHEVVERRDDSLSREVALKVVMGKYEEAIGLMTGREFEVWEGGSLNVADYWTDAHLLRGHKEMAAKRYQEALSDYQTAIEIPDNLPSERRGGGGRQAEADYWIGTAYAAIGDQAKARQAWEEGISTTAPRRRRESNMISSGRGIQIFYQALSLQKLGQAEKAETMLRDLVSSASQALDTDSEVIDFFASFGEQQSQRTQLAMAHYILGLGYSGLNDAGKAKAELNEALKISPALVGARVMLARLD